ncbi:heterokaryon incompatibility protein-domain-containing protein [Lasiosphaeris hirsuta]|uniref:Heterokaryon incompatibility protein-domain-containing protein n=1 Tax=Lasiosphaeris hirsuta TaxID=260670 RepID=A0AA40AGG8_9PEZI|nr:heterokaryon incompatibility protein-domain-containing protein [Lasiosphaeris hirsuta]
MDECLSSHSGCPGKPSAPPPTSLLDVAPRHGEAQMISLVQTRDWPQRDFSKWATLSYSWGGDQPHKTTRQTLSRHLGGIALADMPQTIQDAVAVCRRLGIPYLWIDSLCIIQQDTEDLHHELAQMPQIYQSSLVTIYAASSHAVTEGFLQKRHLWYRKFPPIRLRAQGIAPGAVAAEFSSLILSESIRSDCTYQEMDSARFLEPLDERAWAYQERMLSPRTLVYSSRELSWQCRSAVLRAGNERRWTWPYRFAKPCTPGQATPPWEDFVKEYSRCLLSEEPDKLTAMAAIAEFYQREHSKTYIAGLWKEDLPLALCWLVSANYVKARPEEYRAPSWSWAAIDGQVDLKPMNSFKGKAEILEATTTPRSEVAPLTGVTGGSMTVRGELVWTTLRINVHGAKEAIFARATVGSLGRDGRDLN